MPGEKTFSYYTLMQNGRKAFHRYQNVADTSIRSWQNRQQQLESPKVKTNSYFTAWSSKLL